MKFIDEDGHYVSAKDFCARYYTAKGQEIPARYQQEIDSEEAMKDAVRIADAERKAEEVHSEAITEGGDE